MRIPIVGLVVSCLYVASSLAQTGSSGWLQLVNGGEGPTFVLLSSRKNWADFAPLPKTLADVLSDAYGKEAADQIQKTIRDCTAHQYTEAAAFRADLSYVPGK